MPCMTTPVNWTPGIQIRVGHQEGVENDTLESRVGFAEQVLLIVRRGVDE